LLFIVVISAEFQKRRRKVTVWLSACEKLSSEAKFPPKIVVLAQLPAACREKTDFTRTDLKALLFIVVICIVFQERMGQFMRLCVYSLRKK
jgi:hypothetical protein